MRDGRDARPLPPWVAYLPVAGPPLVIVVMVLSAASVGFSHPDLQLEGGRFEAASIVDGEQLALDLHWRLRWSFMHATWWLTTVGVGLWLVVQLRGYGRQGGERGNLLWWLGAAGTPLLVALMVVLGLAGVAFPGPLARGLQQLPEGATGSVVAASATWVNAGTAGVIYLLAFTYGALVERVRTAPAPAECVGPFDRLLWLAAVVLTVTAGEVTLGYRWAAALVVDDSTVIALARAVGDSQSLVIGGVSTLTLALTSAGAYVALGSPSASGATWALRGVAVSLPSWVALLGTAWTA